MPRTAIVTGGAGGLGRAIAARLRHDGMRVAIADLDVNGLPPDGETEMAIATDVTSPESVQSMMEEVRERWGGIDVLVNNAGVAGPTAPVAEYPVDDWHRVLAVNLGGTFHCTRACLPEMIARGYGRVVNIASIAGKDGNPMMSAYSASKAGVIALTKSAAKENATSGVLINCAVPGVLVAGLTDKATEDARRLFVSRSRWAGWGAPTSSPSWSPGWRLRAARLAPAPRLTSAAGAPSTDVQAPHTRCAASRDR